MKYAHSYESYISTPIHISTDIKSHWTSVSYNWYDSLQYTTTSSSYLSSRWIYMFFSTFTTVAQRLPNSNFLHYLPKTL